ncbi:MAG: UPF0149 family protein [Gammaproteobacteria bacterium]
MTYQTINRIFNHNDADISAAEAHGVATGMLCINERTGCDSWLNELFSNAVAVAEEERRLLLQLFEETGRLLASDQFEFELFLPEEDVLLPEQVRALTHWCQGFLYGVGAASPEPGWTRDAGEILRDISEFTKIDTEVGGEEDEAAFVEITEYLKSAVLLLREEFKPKAARVLH